MEEKLDLVQAVLSRRNERYETDRAKLFKGACYILARYFGLTLTMGQRMIVRKTVHEAINDHKRVRTFLDSFSPDEEAAVRFIHTYYPNLYSNKLSSIAVGGSSEKIKRDMIALDRMYD